MSPLGKYIFRLRDSRGWTIADLSRESNVPYGTIRNIEQNPKPVKSREDTIRKLAEVLEEDGNPELMFTLAGYNIPMSETAESRNRIVDGLMASRPEWRDMLHHIADKLPPEGQDQALQVLRVFVQMNTSDPQ